MREETFGNLRNTLGSVSIAVETGRPVTGHRIITALMGDALRIFIPPGPGSHGTQGSCLL